MATFTHTPVRASTEQHQISTEMQECIDSCVNTHSMCVSMVQYCLKLGGKHADPSHIRMMEDCGEICETAAHYLLRGSSARHRLCALARDICEETAKHCESFGEDPMMRDLILSCRQTAALCDGMADHD